MSILTALVSTDVQYGTTAKISTDTSLAGAVKRTESRHVGSLGSTGQANYTTRPQATQISSLKKLCIRLNTIVSKQM